MSKHGYLKFILMIVTATLIMYAVMYLNTYAFEHIRWSETRVYMTFLMASSMAIIMLTFMWKMYENTKINIAIYVVSIAIFIFCLWLVRTQTTVGDISYMKAMIPHHSIAILTSERANIEDYRVKGLSANIAKTQRREIKEMNWLINDINKNGPAKTKNEASSRPLPKY